MTTIYEHPSPAPITPARKPLRKSAPSETWDEDFVFQQNVERVRDHDSKSSPRQRMTRARGTVTSAALDEFDDKVPGPSSAPVVKCDPVDSLRAWSESPTSPRFRRTPPARSIQRRGQPELRPSEELDQENWDEDFEMGSGLAGGVGLSAKRARVDAAWDSSDDEGDEDFDRDFGFDRDEEDKTVTARSRRRPLGALNNDVPPLPLLPTYLPTIPSGDVSGPYQSPFPRSPTHSVFSIPATVASAGGRDSISGTYSSTAHLALSLRRTHSAESSSPVHQSLANRFPSNSPNAAPRERRRLRKKSRPPHLDGSILELDDKAAPEPSFRPITPESRPSTPPPTSSSAVVSPVTPSSALVPTSSASKSPLLTRIGSMKRWGVGIRRKRASTGPADAAIVNTVITSARASPPSAFSALVDADRVDLNRTPRPHSYASPATHAATEPSPTTSSRFFSRFFGRNQSYAKYSGESDVGASPRRARIRALGQRLLPAPGGSKNSRGSPERRLEKGKEENLDIETDAYSLAHPHPCFVLPLSPLAGETPTRLRPRIPHQAPAALRARPVFPRHASGSAVQDVQGHGPTHAQLAVSASGRSVSASNVSNDDLANSDRMSNSASTSASEKDRERGHRGFMGSIRRISLVGGQKRYRRGHSGPEYSDDAPSPTTANAIPPLPAIPIDTDSLSNSLLPPLELRHQTVASRTDSSGQSSPNANVQKVLTAVPPSLSVPIDLTSPSSSPPRPERLPALAHSKSSSFATSSSSPGRASPVARLTGSPHAASLGRASPLPMTTGAGTSAGAIGSSVHRRNSLGDLKIPSRISRAQDGLKRDLGRVREFAAHVEQMKELRVSYYTIAVQIQTALEMPRPPSRTTSPTNLFNLSRSSSRARSSTNPPHPSQQLIDQRSLVVAFKTIDSKYRVAWECADLLIELGTGTVTSETGQPARTVTTATSTPAADAGKPAPTPAPERQKNRERAVTLAGDEGKPDFTTLGTGAGSSPKANNLPLANTPALLSWRASTGRHDLGQRQLFLLKEMLNNAESAREGTRPDILEAAAHAWGWDGGEGMESSLTLPTEESIIASVSSPTKMLRVSRLNMTGIRDMLRSLTRSHAHMRAPPVPILAAAQSSTTLSTESFDAQSRYGDCHPYSTTGPARSMRRRATATETQPSHSPTAEFNPYMDGIQVAHKSSPRRPSLASLFRLGQKHKASPASSTDQSLDRPVENSVQVMPSEGRTHNDDDDGDDSDWDRMDSTSDIDAQIEAIADSGNTRGTLKLRKKKKQLSQQFASRPITPKHTHSSSQVSVAIPDQSLTNIRSPRLSNVDENNASTSPAGSRRQTPATPESSRRRGADAARAFSSVRTLPPLQSHVKGLPVFDIGPTPAPAPDLKLAMTPENIHPLLENARVVTARLHDCLAEARALISRSDVPVFSNPSTSSANSSSVNMSMALSPALT